MDRAAYNDPIQGPRVTRQHEVYCFYEVRSDYRPVRPSRSLSCTRQQFEMNKSASTTVVECLMPTSTAERVASWVEVGYPL